MKIKCLLHGHDRGIINGQKDRLANQKDERGISFFSGELHYCKRKGCDWERYVGPRRAYQRATIKSVRDNLIEIDRTQYMPGVTKGGVQVLWPVKP